MQYKVASTLNEVTSAWNIVYKQYLAHSLIDPNPYSVFTFPEYVYNDSVVIVGEADNTPICSVSGILDGAAGLPLDKYYKKELNKLRKNGGKLIEIGLLADIREYNNLNSIIELMSAVGKFGVFSNHIDYVVGVHPRRVEFFKRLFGFQVIGDIKKYDKLNVAPVILLFASGSDIEAMRHKVSQDILNSPLDFRFHKRYRFDDTKFTGSKINKFLNKQKGKVAA